MLLEGKASLYSYEDGNTKRYFYKIDNSPIHQLIFKKHTVGQNEFKTNTRFRQQLWNDVSCNQTAQNQLTNIEYRENHLLKWFKKYNECVGEPILQYNKKEDRAFFELKVSPGLNYASFKLENSAYVPTQSIDFGNNISFRLGVEAAFILPFNKNKWRIVIEPTFQYLNLQKEADGRSWKVNYKTIEFPVGLRHSFFINQETSIFLNGFYISSFTVRLNPEIGYDKMHHTWKGIHAKDRDSFAIGGGLAFKKVSIEARYYGNRDIMGNNWYWSTQYTRLSLIVGYKLF